MSPVTSQGLSDAGASFQALEKLLRNRLAFGTAGLRGPMGAGYSRMNPVTVLQCTQGIVAYLEKTNDLGKLKSDGVVIGYDHRDDKAGISSEMMARAGGCGDVSWVLRTSRHACVCYMMRNRICIPSMSSS
jgi:phosphoglucomutase